MLVSNTFSKSNKLLLNSPSPICSVLKKKSESPLGKLQASVDEEQRECSEEFTVPRAKLGLFAHKEFSYKRLQHPLSDTCGAFSAVVPQLCNPNF